MSALAKGSPAGNPIAIHEAMLWVRSLEVHSARVEISMTRAIRLAGLVAVTPCERTKASPIL